MRVISCSLQNFASYKNLEFEFDEQGLTLIQGATGSGKSTLCDAIPWILFGRTAKDGAVDEVKSWNSDGCMTSGWLTIQLSENKILRVVRIRGNAGNDLAYYIESPDGNFYEPARGKDLNDTQKLINNLLSMDHNLYLSVSYFHEFSPIAQFFQTTAKNRRVLCEQLVDLSLAKKLQPKLTDQIKNLNTKYQLYTNDIQLHVKTIQLLERQIESVNKNNDRQERRRIQNDINRYKVEVLADSYIMEQSSMLKAAKLELGSDRCKECGSKKDSEGHMRLQKLEYDLEAEIRISNRAKDRIFQLEAELQAEINKQSPELDLLQGELMDASELLSSTERDRDDVQLNLADLCLLQDLLANLRAVSIKNTIQQLEDQTNQLLSKHFDAEIKVMFEVESADKLDVTIMKDGNQAVFTQLSKGQRQLLKLCFGISVMRIAANHNGISTNCIFLDEAFDGLSEELKVKAYGLLETLRLEYSSIFVVEHSQTLRAMFGSQYTVSLLNGDSSIEKTI